MLKSSYEELFGKIKAECTRQGIGFKSLVLSEVFNFAKLKLPNTDGITTRIQRARRIGKDNKISLSMYLDKKGGVCRHQALFVAYLLEKMIDEGELRGKVSVDRNFVKDRGGHAWARYVTSSGKVVIIDPAQDFLGYLEDVGDRDRWFYQRPKSIVNKFFGMFSKRRK